MKTIWIKAVRDGIRSTEEVKGVTFEVALSPYFMPKALKCEYDPETGVYSVRFNYLDNEPDVLHGGDDLVQIRVGEHTGKLMCVSVRVDEHKVDRVDMRVTDQLLKAIASATPPEMEPNFEAAAEQVRRNKDRMEELVPA